MLFVYKTQCEHKDPRLHPSWTGEIHPDDVTSGDLRQRWAHCDLGVGFPKATTLTPDCTLRNVAAGQNITMSAQARAGKSRRMKSC